MPERKNDACHNKFLWFQFVAELDVKPVKCGLAYEISSWPKTIGFSGETFYRLYLPLSGKFQILHPDGAILIEPGQLYLLPCSMPLKNEGIEPCTHYWIHFVSKQLQTIPMLNQPHGVRLEQPDSVQEKLQNVLTWMKTCTSFAQAVALKNTVTELLVPFLEKLSGPMPDSIELSQFMKIVDYIDLRLDRDIEIAELNALAGMSRAEFSAAFRRVFGVPPKQYVSLRRLLRARQLLLETPLPIKEIAAQCGYHDEFFFHRIFKKYMKITPAKYRKHVIY